jgi:rhodanese-related sulfurtransferase
MVNLSKLDIMATGLPVIANVRSPGTSSFDHWVCVVFVDGRLMVFDGASPPVAMSFASFLSLWNGYGVVVSPAGQPVVAAIWSLRIGSIAALLVVGLALQALAAKIRPARLQATAGLAGACLTLAILGNFVFGDVPHLMSGVRLAASSGRAAISGREFESIPRRDLENYVLIDARYFDTYKVGAIERSINIPVDTSEIALKGLFEGIDRDVPILVYCHSASCGFDSVIAGKLTRLGFRDVNVSHEGWVEYSAARNDPPRTGDPKSALHRSLDEAPK